VKKLTFFFVFLLITFLHIAGFVFYDLYKNHGKNLSELKNIKISFNLPKIKKNTEPEKYVRKKISFPPQKISSHQPRIYSWVDNSGVMHFSDKRPLKHIKNFKEEKAYVSNNLGSSETIANKMSPYSFNSKTTRILIKGHQIFIPVRLVYHSQMIQVMLLLDTGATTTVIYDEAASRLNLWKREKSYSIVADGRKIYSERACLDYIMVGPHKFKNFQVSIINYSGNNDHYTGLLGMNFLKNLKYNIDYSNQIITWE
jgi:predicted aspartyl protease